MAALAAVAYLAYNALQAATLPWAVMPLALYAFGMARAMPAMSSIAQAHLPTMRGMVASLQSFVQMFIFALVAGCAAPFVFDNPLRTAEGLAVAVASGIACLGREPGAWPKALAQRLFVRSLTIKRPYACGQESQREFDHDTFVIVDHAS
ncbi:hypothetical protein [Paraburkholderia sp. SIMBA_053]|uniref:hypothetical protein n=1 Tax=Paraburkholderia sp. SIMBA_053 TaxID=3085794 RepID=UPI00397D8CCB